MVDLFLDLKPRAKPFKKTDRVEVICATPRITAVSRRQSEAHIKNSALCSILTPGQLGILQEYAQIENLEDEYSALCKLLSELRSGLDKMKPSTGKE